MIQCSRWRALGLISVLWAGTSLISRSLWSPSECLTPTYSRVTTNLESLYVGAPRGPLNGRMLHVWTHTLFHTDICSILMGLCWRFIGWLHCRGNWSMRWQSFHRNDPRHLRRYAHTHAHARTHAIRVFRTDVIGFFGNAFYLFSLF